MNQVRARWIPVGLLVAACGARSELNGGTRNDDSTAPLAGTGGASGMPDVTGGIGGAPLRTRCTLSADDPRVAGIEPDEIATLDGADFVDGDVQSYRWTLREEDCDAVVPNAQYKLEGQNGRVMQFQPSRPAPYHFTLEVTGRGGDHASCEMDVPVRGVGLRVELCWDTSTSTDLDVYLHTPFNRAPWFTPTALDVIEAINGDTCNTLNATAMLRTDQRVNWGYTDSPLEACSTPAFEGFLGIGRCPNPRAADDNNQAIATGTTERLQLDNPSDGQRFRVMTHNFNNRPARPHVYVYCSGQRMGAFDAPAGPSNFVAPSPGVFGVMWRAADITTRVGADGAVSCQVEPVTERDAVSIDDPTF